MADGLIFSVCGLICDDCEYFKGEKEPRCLGCTAHGGKPFWGECPTYACVEEHGVDHCGLCGEFPCDRFVEMYDPSQGQVSAVVRAGILAYRAKHGDEKAAELSRKIGH
ncbi:MAG: DUF3795 domain-containing protein [Candidatus Bathyarchaeota archaeon]|nr:MAG: DUF3795 domain-containing protein [Candidatus Bathyarchaeota archaeon]